MASSPALFLVARTGVGIGVMKRVERFAPMHGDPEALLVVDDRDHDAFCPGFPERHVDAVGVPVTGSRSLISTTPYCLA
jgi:hypothetical protein